MNGVTVYSQGDSLSSDNRDDCCIFRVEISDLMFLGVVQAKFYNKIKPVFVRV